MRMLFSTSDPERVERVRSLLNKANIACDVRQSTPDHLGLPGYPEVWVRDGVDFEYASVIFCNWASREIEDATARNGTVAETVADE